MAWIEGRKMSEILRKDTPGEDILNPDIDSRTLGLLYSQMAEILLELWKLDFDCIGCLGQDQQSGQYMVDGPPLTLEVNELMRTCGLGNRTPSGVYHSSTDYIASLLQLQSTHLRDQQNSVYDSEDCREKYACRHLMKAIAFDFISQADNQGPFKLFCEDFGPGNVLKEGATGVSPECRLSARMRKSIKDKSAWFILAARMVSSVDMIYWELLDEFCWRPRSTIAERVHNVTTIPKKHRERERFVRLKIRHLQEYYTELGEESTVEYEEEGFTKPQETFDHGTSEEDYRQVTAYFD
ncbi:hypothetical protein ACP6JD_007656 [Aspergillus fumigatus]